MIMTGQVFSKQAALVSHAHGQVKNRTKYMQIAPVAMRRMTCSHFFAPL